LYVFVFPVISNGLKLEGFVFLVMFEVFERLREDLPTIV